MSTEFKLFLGLDQAKMSANDIKSENEALEYLGKNW